MAPLLGSIPWNKGLKGVQKHSEDTKKRISETCKAKGIKPPSQKGKPSLIKGLKWTEEQKLKLKGKRRSVGTEFKKGESSFKGKIHSQETKDKISKTNKGNLVKSPRAYSFPKGEKNPLWKGGKACESRRLRGTSDWRKWRKSVFERDDYTCRECNVRGGKLEPHHIIPLKESLVEAFNIKNGITLCRPCHKKTMWKESSFAEKYSLLVAAQV